MQSLSERERRLVDRMLKQLSMRARTEYLTYRQSAGYKVHGFDDMELASSLYRKGWVTADVDLVDTQPIFLTHEAWKRFALDEWQEIDERVMEEKRGEISGSW